MDIFQDEDKMKSFIADSTGHSERDREINNEIEQISKRISKRSSRCSLNVDVSMLNPSVTSRNSVVGRKESRTSLGRLSLPGGLRSKESRTSIGSRFSNLSECLSNTSQEQTSFQCEF